MPIQRRSTGLSTVAVHGSRVAPIANRPASDPIFQSAAWEFESLEQAEAIFEHRVEGAEYGTRGVPNHRALESVIAELEGAEAALATNGGMAALAATFLTLLAPGERVVASRDLFGATAALLAELGRWGVETTYVNGTDVEAVRKALAQRTKLLVVETISNPRLRVPDIPTLADLAHRHGALLMVDNTFAGPYHCRPLKHGCDVVVESATKSLAGHHDVVIGAVAGSAVMVNTIAKSVRLTGMAPGPFEAWLAVRGITTLSVRQERAAANAAHVAAWLADRPEVAAVHYPALPSHPDHTVASQLLERGFGAIVSLELSAGRTAVEAFLKRLRRIRLVHSLGGARTTLSHSVTMTHRLVAPEVRSALGIHDGFFRLSLGIENVEDIIEDLEQGLATLSATVRTSAAPSASTRRGVAR